MKTILTVAILGLTGLAGAVGAEAQDVRRYRNDDHRETRVEYRHPSWFSRLFRRHSAPRVERVWVPARYESRFSGYDHCGKPIHRSVCVCEGYWTSRPVCD